MNSFLIYKRKNTIMVTKEQIKTITGILDDKVLTSITSGLTITMEKYEINTKLRICHFLSQILHESGNFKCVKENLNYCFTKIL